MAVGGWGFNKPPVGSKIDWSNPMSNGLVGCFLLNEGAGTKCHNLANNYNIGTLTTAPWSKGLGGIGIKFSNTAGERVSGTIASLSGSRGLTMAFGFQATGASNYTIGGIGSTASDQQAISLRANSSTVLGSVLYGRDLSGTFSSYTNKLCVGVYQHKKNGARYLYLNGVRVSVGNNGSYGGNGAFKIGAAPFSDSERFQGWVYFGYYWNRDLSDQECIRICYEPYDVIKYPRRRRYFVAGGGGSSFQNRLMTMGVG